MSCVTDATPAPAEAQSARERAFRNLLYTGRLPEGVRTVLTCLLASESEPPTVAAMAGQFGCAERTVTLWLRRAKAVGLLSVTREGKRNRYAINHQQLQRLADERAGR